MTMPHLMNCEHSIDSWCPECVRKLWEEKENYRAVLMAEADKYQEKFIELAEARSKRWHLEGENARFRGALEQYANRENWQDHEGWELNSGMYDERSWWGHWTEGPRLAREALGKDKD